MRTNWDIRNPETAGIVGPGPDLQAVDPDFDERQRRFGLGRPDSALEDCLRSEVVTDHDEERHEYEEAPETNGSVAATGRVARIGERGPS